MRKPTFSLKKVLFVAVGSILITIALVILFVSPLTKYMIEKHDVRWIGRELSMDWAYANPFTGYVYLSNLKVFEEKSDTVFLSASGFSVNLSLYKLLSKHVEISQFTIDRPWTQVVQREKQLNFDDIILKFTPDKLDTLPSNWQITLLNIKVIDGEFHYVEKIIPINYFIKKVNIESAGLEQDADSIFAKFNFQEASSRGDAKGGITLNVKNAGYRLTLNVLDFDMEIIRQYIWELINYGMFSARLSANIEAVGNFNSRDSISLSGQLAVNDFRLGKTVEDDYLSFKKLVVAVEELSPIYNKYLFDSVLLFDPYLKYERYDSLDNIQAMFGKMGKNISDVTQQTGRFNLVIEIARYVEVLSRNFFKSDYKIGKLGIYNADLVFNDYSLSEKFFLEASPLTITADSINKNRKRVDVLVTTAFKPFGGGNLSLSINPKDSGNFDLRYKIEKIPVSMFNPYLISYTSFPLDRGTMEFNGWWSVRNGKIKSNNHVVVIDPRVTRKIKNKDTKWLPMPLIMSLIRERGNVIDYQIPITGNLKHPKFHLLDVVFDAIKNIFVKPPTTPYRYEIKSIENKIEKSLTVKWEISQHKLRDHQERFTKKIAEFLKDNPNASLHVHPIEYTNKEKEQILFFETKKKYFLIARSKNVTDFSKQDSAEVSIMSVKNPSLVAHISKNLSDTVMFTLQEKCFNFVGKDVVDNRFHQLAKDRETSFRQLFLKNGTDGQLKMYASESGIPYNGFSYFKLDYPGEIPDALRKAYGQMIDFNDEAPRKKYIKQRKAETAIEGQSGTK